MTSLRGRSFLPTISARSGDGVTGAVMPPRAPPAGLPAASFFAAVSSFPRFSVDRAIFYLRAIYSIIDDAGHTRFRLSRTCYVSEHPLTLERRDRPISYVELFAGRAAG